MVYFHKGKNVNKNTMLDLGNKKTENYNLILWICN